MSAEVQNASKEQPAARALAEWWAEQLGAPVHKVVGDTATGEDRFRGDFAFLVMQGEVAKHPMGDGAGERFVEALTPVVSQMLDRGDWISLGVDYGPDLALADAAEKAGIHLSRFPWKTNSWATPNYVSASLGYRGPDRLVWKAPGWDIPPCGSMGYDEATHLFSAELCGLPRCSSVMQRCGRR